MTRAYAVENVSAECATPIIDLSLLKGSDFSEDWDVTPVNTTEASDSMIPRYEEEALNLASNC